MRIFFLLFVIGFASHVSAGTFWFSHFYAQWDDRQLQSPEGFCSDVRCDNGKCKPDQLSLSNYISDGVAKGFPRYYCRKYWGQGAGGDVYTAKGYIYPSVVECQDNEVFEDGSCREISPGTGLGRPECSLNAGDHENGSVNSMNGNNFMEAHDVIAANEPRFRFALSYNSQSSDRGIVGRGWRANMDVKIRSTKSPLISIVSGAGRSSAFRQNRSAWVDVNNSKLQVSSESGEDGLPSQFTVKNQKNGVVDEFDGEGRLVKRQWNDGYTISVERTKEIINYTDTSGRVYQLLLDQGKAVGLSFGGRNWAFSYNSDEMLTTVTQPDASTKSYRYENADDPSKLTGVLNESGVRALSWLYDDEGRVVEVDFLGKDQIAFDYRSDFETEVTNEFGKVAVFTSASFNGVEKLTEIGREASANCPSDMVAAEYDQSGNLTQTTNRNGVQSAFTRNERGLVTSRRDALGTPAERLVQITWHPSMAIPLKIEGPEQVEEFCYNENGRLFLRRKRDHSESPMTCPSG